MVTSPPASPTKARSPPPTAPPALHGGHVFTFPSSSPLPEETIAPPASSSPSHHRHSTSPIRVGVPMINRRSSDSDLSSPPRGNSLTGSSGSGSGIGSGTRLTHSRSCVQQQNIEMLEFPFFTMRSFPVGFIVHLGGVVSARSVKLLDRIHNPEEPETRDTWWTEIRTEIRSHARAMGCHAVIGYVEQTSICDEIIILSASGTAARVNLVPECQPSIARTHTPLTSSLERQHSEKEREKEKDKKLFVDINLANQLAQNRLSTSVDGGDDGLSLHNCGPCHIPYKSNSVPFNVSLTPCVMCRRKKVPDILFSTIDPPPEVLTWGKGCLIQARICRVRTKTKGETGAKEVSDCLPFMEYELHSQLMNKLKMKGMNGLFGLKIQVTVGDTMIVAVGTATSAYLGPLPPPPVPKISNQTSLKGENDQVAELQKKIMETLQGNRERFGLDLMDTQGQPSPRSMATDESEDEQSDLELSAGNRDTFVLEIDDVKDEMILAVLQDLPPPDGIETCNTLIPPSVTRDNININLQMFTQVWRGRLAPQTKADFADMFESLLRKIYFKLRKLVPLVLADLDFNVEIPDEDEIQISVTGCCLGVTEVKMVPSTGHLSLPSTGIRTPQKTGTGEGEEMIFPMDIADGSSGISTPASGKVLKPLRVDSGKKLVTSKPKIPQTYPHGVELSPLPIVAGGKIDRYLGNYNFFFIRESTAVREGGGLSGFMQTAIAEVMAIVRAHVASLGGNALVAYKMTHCILYSNPHKNQSQCLVSVCGDAVCASFGSETVLAVVPPHLEKTGDSPKLVSSAAT